MSVSSALGNAIFSLLPARNELLYRFCRKIVNRYQGDNNGNMTTNGELTLLRRSLFAGAVVVDVGANQGEWTAAALGVQPDVAIHAFEPSRSTFAILQNRRFPPIVALNNAGLGEATGRLELFVFEEGLGANSLYDRRGTDATVHRREPVEILRLDDYCADHSLEHVDFLKIDVEGHEFAVLRGARRLLAEGRLRITQFEYGGTYIDARVLLKDVWDFVMEINPEYRFFKLLPNALLAVPRYRQVLETFQYSNWAIMTAATAGSLGIPIVYSPRTNPTGGM